MEHPRFSMLGDDWEVGQDGSFISPLVKERPEQTLIFGDRIRNGSIMGADQKLESDLRKAIEALGYRRSGNKDGRR